MLCVYLLNDDVKRQRFGRRDVGLEGRINEHGRVRLERSRRLPRGGTRDGGERARRDERTSRHDDGLTGDRLYLLETARTMTLRNRFLATGLVLVLTACSNGARGAGSGAESGSPSPQATNPVDFPLFDGASLLSTRAWHEKISSRPGVGDNTLLSQGAGTYDGHDVVAATQALMPALEAWLQNLDANPPSGYTSVAHGTGVDAVRAHTRNLGIDFAVFERTENGKRHGVVVLAVDPQTLDAKAGPMLGVVGKFKLLPQPLRDSIDAQAKKQTGFTLSEATNPDSPLGAAVGALARLRDFGGRGVILIDAVKQ